MKHKLIIILLLFSQELFPKKVIVPKVTYIGVTVYNTYKDIVIGHNVKNNTVESAYDKNLNLIWTIKDFEPRYIARPTIRSNGEYCYFHRYSVKILDVVNGKQTNEINSTNIGVELGGLQGCSDNAIYTSFGAISNEHKVIWKTADIFPNLYQYSLAIDSSENLYILNGSESRIISPAGKILNRKKISLQSDYCLIITQ